MTAIGTEAVSRVPRQQGLGGGEHALLLALDRTLGRQRPQVEGAVGGRGERLGRLGRDGGREDRPALDPAEEEVVGALAGASGFVRHEQGGRRPSVRRGA